MIRTALIAALLSATIAVPAMADTGRTANRTATDGSTVCLRDPGSARCADYQMTLIRTVEKATVHRAAVSTSDVGRRQLNALIASIN